MKGAVTRAVVLLLLATALEAHAAGNIAQAKEFFQQGQTDFALGKFLDAAQAFEAAYREVPRPELLWNIAKAYRKQYEIDRDLEHLRRARVLYRNYAQLVTSAKERGEARQEEVAVVAEIQRVEQAEAGGAGTDAAGGTGTISPSPLPPDRSVPDLASPGPTQRVGARDSGSRPLHRRWWLWTVVGGAVGAGLGVGLGVGLTRGAMAMPITAGSQLPPGF